jgi:phosphoserine phosphatase
LKPDQSPTLLIVDLCHTLIAENTTNAFLDGWLIRDDWRWRRRLRRSILGRKRPVSVLGLRGLPKAFVYERAEAYVRDRLARLSNPEPLNAIRCAQSANIPVYLATASLDPVAVAVKHQLKLDGAVYSRLEYDRRGSCTGLFAQDVTGKKLACLRRLLPESQLRGASVYTDNVEDVDIIRIALKPHFLGERRSLARLSDAELE